MAGVAWLTLIYFVEPKAGKTSGREIATRIAQAIPDGARVWADGLIEARPETLFYARETAATEGREWNVCWKKAELTSAQLPPPGGFLVLRTDDDEAERYRSGGKLDQLEALLDDSVHRYRFVLYRVLTPCSQRMEIKESTGTSQVAMAPP
jgi:hypothetical protein